MIDIAAPQHALGPYRTAGLLARELAEDGVPARLVERLDGTEMANVHLANSSRSLLAPLARREGCLVTLHDVVPRDPYLRRALTPVLHRALRRHRVVVHSRYAAGLLSGTGFRGPVGVVPVIMPVIVPDEPTRVGERNRLLEGRGGPLLVLAGVLKAAKGVGALVRAASVAPDARFVLLGDLGDKATARIVGRAPANVSLIQAPDDRTFSTVLAASDALLLLRTESVGETSGPLVMAHALGTPVAMLDSGAAPEYECPGDLMVPAGTPLEELVLEAVARQWARMPSTRAEELAGALAAYRREFKAQGWL